MALSSLRNLIFRSSREVNQHHPDRNALGSSMLATSAVASAGPTPGMVSSRLPVSFDRCQAIMRRSKAMIRASMPAIEPQERRPFRHAGQQYAGRFEQIHPERGVSALRDWPDQSTSPGVAPARQSDVGADTSRTLEPCRIIKRCLEAKRSDRANVLIPIEAAGHSGMMSPTIPKIIPPSVPR